ncbi:MAG TPA: Gfo/Idh/MocA family oxidoreductase [Lacipirellulaceae bacterium]|nr:Gfo/Idh/MocA family oxidoreductase [Lacipirellulaceae bacterium]
MSTLNEKSTRRAKVPALPRVPAPQLPYRPRDPKKYRPGIGLIGCGGITKWHLTAYKRAGYRILALCDIALNRARERRDEFYPEALATDDVNEILARDDIEVVDITTHPPERPPLVEAALRAHKHVLSQKPFVLDLDVGHRLADLADEMGVKLAVNQNARWAPHFSYIREAVRAGLLGSIDALHCDVHWDHSWVQGTVFETVRHLILYDFAIHWFDFVRTIMAHAEPRRIYASMARSATQTVVPALLAQTIIEYESTQATLIFDGFTRFDRLDRTLVVGSAGAIRSTGPSTEYQRVEMTTADGLARPRLKGAWFPDGFHGTMAELLSAVAENREPSNSARNNLASLSLCFAAVTSAERGEAVRPGSVRRLHSETDVLNTL